MLAAAVAALPLAIPVAHLHGGEVTEGAIDEQARHAITKLAHLHFPAAEPYARRILQMGEEPWRVHCCGRARPRSARPPRDVCRATELARRVGPAAPPPDPARDLPPGDARARGDRARRSDELAAALDAVDGDVVITYPGRRRGITAR